MAPPDANEIAEARTLVGCDDLLLDPQLAASSLKQPYLLDRSAPVAMLRRARQGLDLGGIGKGYAADRCRHLLIESGVRHAWLDLGGQVLLLGSRPDGSPWRVGIQDPSGARGKWLARLNLQDTAIATAGGYERGFEVNGQRYSHILDPRTGEPANSGLASATIVGHSTLRCDVLATACVVLGLDAAWALVASCKGLEALFVINSGEVIHTPGLTGCIAHNERA
jgi:thiamine biosynthesis lipoprotein